jgi:hypothetical protein
LTEEGSVVEVIFDSMAFIIYDCERVKNTKPKLQKHFMFIMSSHFYTLSQCSIIFFTEYCSGDYIKEVEVGGTCGTHGGTGFSWLRIGSSGRLM